MTNNFVRLVVFIIICEAAGIAGTFPTVSSVATWYPTLTKPFFTPPSWVFGPVWTVLYLLMGISLYLVWGKKKVTMTWFWMQLGLNVIWSFAFFGLQNPLLGFIVILLLWISIFLTIQIFIKTQRTAAYLLIPYLLWVSFAAVLNLFIVILN